MTTTDDVAWIVSGYLDGAVDRHTLDVWMAEHLWNLNRRQSPLRTLSIWLDLALEEHDSGQLSTEKFRQELRSLVDPGPVLG